MDAFQYIQITAAFSNAVLEAVLPGVWSVSAQLSLAVPDRVAQAQVARLSVSDIKGRVDGTLVLDNGFQFAFTDGDVHACSSPRNLFALEDWSRLDHYAGKARMSEREAIELARQALRRMGYDPGKVLLNRTPDRLEHVEKLPRYSTKDFAFYSMTWKIVIASDHVVILSVMVDAHEKQVCGLHIGGRPGTTRPWSVGVEPPVIATVPLPFTEPERRFFITPAYSNAMLNAVLPVIAAVAKQLNPAATPPPLRGQVAEVRLNDRQGEDGGSLQLSSGARYFFSRGYVGGFESPRNFGFNQEWGNFAPYAGKAQLTRSEALLFARQALARLGYDRLRLGLERPPDELEITEKLPGYPKLEFGYFDLSWRNHRGDDFDETFRVVVDAHEKQICYFNAGGRRFWRPLFKVEMEPPLKPQVIRPTQNKLIAVPNPPDLKGPSQPPKPSVD